ncbi:hypothetical protein ACA910_006070 [Epithemia clementina (nom. ined.)]
MVSRPLLAKEEHSDRSDDLEKVESDDHASPRSVHSLSSDGHESSDRAAKIEPLEHQFSRASSKTADNPDNIVPITTALCICMMAHSYLLISVFPYSGYMAVNLVSNLNEDSAGSYAGILASALMVGRATTAYGWGKVADLYGRTTVLCLSLGMASFLSLLFGFSPSFGWAVLLRFCLGMSNGVLGTLRTTVSEIARGDEKLETRVMMIVMGMWSWGMLISPAMSGALSDPLRQYPNAKLFASSNRNHDWIRSVLERFPFLLPNLLGSILCFAALCLVFVFLKETLPSHEQQSARQMLHHFFRAICTPSSSRKKAYKRLDDGGKVEVDTCGEVLRRPTEEDGDDSSNTQSEDSSDESSESGLQLASGAPESRAEIKRGNHNSIRDDDDDFRCLEKKNKATMFSILARSETRTYLLVYWSASFVSVAFNEIFPLFCMSRVAGLALDERHIGQIMSLCGLLFAISQYGVQSLAYNKFGLLGSVRVGAILGSPMIFLVPISLLLNQGSEVGNLRFTTMLFLAFVLAINRICVMVFYSNVAVAMNRSVPPDHRATAQGVCGMGENIAKGLGPSFAGFLTSSAVRSFGHYGSLLTFGTVGAIGTIFALCTLFCLRDVSVDSGLNQEIEDSQAPTDVEVGGDQ